MDKLYMFCTKYPYSPYFPIAIRIWLGPSTDCHATVWSACTFSTSWWGPNSAESLPVDTASAHPLHESLGGGRTAYCVMFALVAALTLAKYAGSSKVSSAKFGCTPSVEYAYWPLV